MHVGIFAKTFVRPSLYATLEAVAEHGLACIQFNFSVTGLPTLPDRIDGRVLERVKRVTADRGIEIAAVSGTFNMIDPNLEKRRDGLRRLRVLAEAAARIGAPVITLCSGTRDPYDMWQWHPENAAPEAWDDLVESMKEAVAIARDNDITVAFEPEVANVVNTAQKARRLLDEIDAPQLQVIIDPPNLVRRDKLPHMGEIIDEAFVLLGGDIVLAHAKDIAHEEESGFAPAGRGLLDYDLYIQRLTEASYKGPLVLHTLGEADVNDCVAFLCSKLAAQRSAEAD